jgi:hypothetical protein
MSRTSLRTMHYEGKTPTSWEGHMAEV